LIVGEAANNITAEFRDGHPEIPWGQIIGMRNRLVHAYFEVSLDLVWETATMDMPELSAQVSALLMETADGV
jgi:uncharacterized protein with HEPN domain